MHVTAIIAAGGRGTRLGGAQPKQFVELNGRTMLERSVRLFSSHPDVHDVVVALPRELVATPPPFLNGLARVRVVAGGDRRQDSVARAFEAALPSTDVVVIHDAARPFASADLVARTIAAAAASGAAIAAVQAHDTVKVVKRAEIQQTLARESVYLAQTPQAFRRDVLAAALALGERDEIAATDEASLAERAGHRVTVVDGEASNIKITTADDLAVAEAITRGGKPARTGRVGTGYDLHRLVDGRPLVLGGVTIPFERGPQGHSDGDAVCHAITDAVLGAASAGNIGQHFPDTDPRWRGASSLDLLRRAAALVREAGLEVGNVDATIILERPKLAPHVAAMRAKIAEALGVAEDRVSVKGKTNEGVGELGRGEAVAVHAVALIRTL